MVNVKTNVKEVVKKYAKNLSSQIEVDKIILVGAYAEGSPNEWSDIEVVVISDSFTDMNSVDRLKILTHNTKGMTSLLVPFNGYTPDEYEHPQKTLHMGWIKSRGKILYDSKKIG